MKIKRKKRTCNHLRHDLVFVKNINKCKKIPPRSVWKCPDCGELFIRKYEFNQGEVSDGYHTFNELYHHRAILTATLFNAYKERAWKSKKHDDGSMYDGMFIVGIETPKGTATYHYDINPYWDMFDIKEIPNAPKWDGHTPDDAIERIYSLTDETRFVEYLINNNKKK
jgi:hypothetical protein